MRTLLCSFKIWFKVRNNIHEEGLLALSIRYTSYNYYKELKKLIEEVFANGILIK